MKTLELNQMESINAAEASGRGCLIAGAGALVTAIGGFFAPPVWGATAAIVSGAALAGCFDE
jgi:dipeptide/tripeptide permease